MTRTFAFLLLAALACGQSAAPAFEVASVRPAPPSPQGVADPPVSEIDSARVRLHLPLQGIVCAAYGVRADQVIGPQWIVNTRFDVEAKLPEGATVTQVPAMLQSLLADRFKLTMHRETREQEVYALVVPKDGLKMKAKTTASADAEPVPEGTRDGCYPHAGTTGAPGGRGAMAIANGDMKMTSGEAGQRIEMSRIPSLVEWLNAELRIFGRLMGGPSIVIDKTGLTGEYEIVMQQKAPPADQTPEDALATLRNPWFLASMEKLGLKLEKQKAPIETIVIDSIERNPTAN